MRMTLRTGWKRGASEGAAICEIQPGQPRRRQPCEACGYFHWQATKDGLIDQEEVKEYINKREDECSEANKLSHQLVRLPCFVSFILTVCSTAVGFLD
jgi:spore germination protein GerM